MRRLGNYKIAVVGLGYVGLPLAVEFGKKYRTLGFDINPLRIKELKAALYFDSSGAASNAFQSGEAVIGAVVTSGAECSIERLRL